jgi:hypothetical protein
MLVWVIVQLWPAMISEVDISHRTAFGVELPGLWVGFPPSFSHS